MNDCFFFDEGSLFFYAGHGEAAFKRECLIHTGKLAAEARDENKGAHTILQQIPHVYDGLCESVTSNNLTAWSQAVVRELMLHHTQQGTLDEKDLSDLPNELRKTAPTPGTATTLEILIKNQTLAAMAMFPLSGEDAKKPPTIGLAWVEASPVSQNTGTPQTEREKNRWEESADHLMGQLVQQRYPGLSDTWNFIPSFVVEQQGPAKQEPFGNSWKLSMAMAASTLMEFIHSGQREKKTIVDLASSWIMTGDIDERAESIRKVDVGNKDKLFDKLGQKHRKAIVPAADLSWRSETATTPYRFAHTIDTARAHILGRGIVDGEPVQLPADGTGLELHQLLGHSYPVPLALPLLILYDRLVLWYSDDKTIRERCENLVRIYRKLGMDKPECFKMDSKKTTVAERQIEEQLRAAVSSGDSTHRQVLFNVTGGNRLMSFAAMSIARSRPNMTLCYKDIDDKTTLTTIRYEGAYPSTAPLYLEKEPMTQRQKQALEVINLSGKDNNDPDKLLACLSS